MLSQEEMEQIKQKKAENDARNKELSRLDAVAADVKAFKNPHVGRITVKSADGEVKHIWEPKNAN